MATDPVCGMVVDEKKAATSSEIKMTSEYKGKVYYFCSLGCKRAFDKEPERYLKGEPRETGWAKKAHN